MEILRDKIYAVESSLYFKPIDGTDADPGGFLISYAGLEAEYRHKKTPAEFLSEREVFANRILHVMEEGERALRWYNFAKTYKPEPTRVGAIMIETRTPPLADVSQNVRVLKYEDFVTEYDALVFAGLLLADGGMEVACKRYIAALAVALFGTDAARVAEFVEDFDFDHDDPELFAASMGVRGDVSRRVWNAQAQTLFPLIMFEHREFIDKWHEEIKVAFEYANNMFPRGLEYLGEQVTSPDEMELATLRYLTLKKRGDASERFVLHIPDEKVSPRLGLLYNTRNMLAHGKVCTAEDVRELLGA
ncbi:MAG: hypothetical protein LBD04_07010 [Synergistaceae bacterium]|nr:hypothetical protein [Synergistaceae bacterium]